MPHPLVAVIMGSSSDWETMQHTVDVLEHFGVEHERHIVSAHRTPVWMAEFATGAEARGVEVIIAGAGGAAHLPGMVAAHTVLPVLGVPVQSAALQGLDSLLSIVQMPGGVPVGTLAIGKAGATNAGILAVSILANSRPDLRTRLRDGHHFKATFIGARDATIVVQRKTRVPVSVEEVPYDAIASLSRVQPGSMSAGKVAGIALGSAGAVIGVLWLIALASFD